VKGIQSSADFADNIKYYFFPSDIYWWILSPIIPLIHQNVQLIAVSLCFEASVLFAEKIQKKSLARGPWRIGLKNVID